MTPYSWGSFDIPPTRAVAPPHSTARPPIQRYCGRAKLLSKAGQELGEVIVALDKRHSEGGLIWHGLIETADRSPIDRLLRRRSKGTVVLPGGSAGTVGIRRLTAHSPIAALTGSGEPPF